MKASYSRLFANDHGGSTIVDLELPLTVGFAVPPAEPLYTAPFLAPTIRSG